ncbi:MAG: hypothetical protein H6553_14080 [Chitinophagales bacterium]|nr:hypothetical protein [Chitinophagales bacterium]
MTFIKPKDPIIAQLLFELGNINAINYDVKSGLEVYLVAKEYGYTSDLIDKRIEYFEKLQSKAEFKNSKEKAKRKVSSNAHFILIGFTISILLLIIFSIYIYKKNKNQSSLS